MAEQVAVILKRLPPNAGSIPAEKIFLIFFFSTPFLIIGNSFKLLGKNHKKFKSLLFEGLFYNTHIKHLTIFILKIDSDLL